MPYRLFFLLFIGMVSCNSKPANSPVAGSDSTSSGQAAREQYRPFIHFTPKEHWMNDPNGMFLLDGVYNLYFQYYPGDTKWGPMHWGHATSTDLVNWKEEAVALYPDSLGYIFSGSAVVDTDNTSGFGKGGQVPVVAVFTYHDPKGADAKRNDYQSQGLAYSLDKGMTWKKYEGNPVLKNPGIVDFRDPKVSWNKKTGKWVMTLATKDRISFYSSPDLKQWTKLSEFGEKLGAHGGVWECPDLFPLPYNGTERWVLLVSINPGGPNGGSATQYFVGDFNGREFIPSDTSTRFIDYGTDNYAGVTVANTGNRTLFIGWMSNWLYGEKVPTVKWRSAMTLPRELRLLEAGGKPYLASMVVPEIGRILQPSDGNIPDTLQDNRKAAPVVINRNDSVFGLSFNIPAVNFELALLNKKMEKFIIGFDQATNRFYMDRSAAGNSDFYPAFASRHWAPRISSAPVIQLNLVVDVSSVELFADEGLTVMTDIFFPSEPFTKAEIRSDEISNLKSVRYAGLK